MKEKVKILLVDDDKNFREIWKTKLVSSGFEVIEAESGEEALKILETLRPNVVLLDIMMPGMNGVEVFLKIKENPELQNTKIIFVTALDNETEDFEFFKEYHEKLANEIGAFSYLAKTTDLDKLVDKINEALTS